jgi:Protein of unknown function (DUF2721)
MVPVESHVSDITHVIQLAVAPVFLLTAVGTIINALTSRLGRAVDRRRVLEDHLREFAADEADTARDELSVLAKRINLIYYSIGLAVTCGLLVCLLIVVAFLGAFVALDLARVIGALFVFAMLALTGSLLMLLREVFLAVSGTRHIFK